MANKSTLINLESWNRNAEFWDKELGNGNDIFSDLILPTIEELADIKYDERVLDLGTGNGIVARHLIRTNIKVLATDYSEEQIKNTRRRIDEFDIVTASILLKELRDISLLAEFLPKIMKPTGRVIMANLHPYFHKPAAHRVIEVIQPYIKVSEYLNIGPVQSQALRGQPEPLIWFHRPIHELLNPFFKAGLALNDVREPSFQSSPNMNQYQSYHNFPQIPIQFVFRLVRRFRQ
ncbi:S-adenosyl-L-methionine-dependent methyltransferase [Lasiosphaeria ovina]|uniref:S-adenosyl-L-methionine-dependent methyltransferase n=1 Tax=Lasiosphaeria ovina TaxID=92902 RepID=A0AAE0N3H9_9PEZI|nr:S-adenosyl-L-methionine-dependent methyltransferase [Lasiosphaeria ovina]